MAVLVQRLNIPFERRVKHHTFKRRCPRMILLNLWVRSMAKAPSDQSNPTTAALVYYCNRPAPLITFGIEMIDGLVMATLLDSRKRIS